MTTLCLCDWVETQVERERRLARDAAAAGDAPCASPGDAGHAITGAGIGAPGALPAPDTQHFHR